MNAQRGFRSVKGEFPACVGPVAAGTCGMLIAWTTVAKRDDAERLAADIAGRGLAACVQVDGPIASHYRWEGKPTRTEEFRVTFKLLDHDLPALEQHVLAIHPYDTPEWLVVRAERVGEKYLSWASANSSTPPL